MSEGSEIINLSGANEADWERADRSRHAARDRYKASEKGKVAYARQLELQRKRYAEKRERDFIEDGRVGDDLAKPEERPWMDGVWYEDDPRAVHGRL